MPSNYIKILVLKLCILSDAFAGVVAGENPKLSILYDTRLIILSRPLYVFELYFLFNLHLKVIYSSFSFVSFGQCCFPFLHLAVPLIELTQNHFSD